MFARRSAARGVKALCLGVLVVALLVATRSSSDLGTDLGIRCNGHAELCERRIDEGAFAATHNSMSSEANIFGLPNHTGAVVEQLEAGYRGLLIDTWYRDRSPDIGSTRSGGEIVLCHDYRSRGNVRAVDVFKDIVGWLERHRREVIILFIEDTTRPPDTAAAFDAAGLDRHAYAHEWRTPMPTLGEMIEADKRVFVMAENDAGQIDWYHDGFRYTQDTPFDFAAVHDLSCAPNRGMSSSPLLMVNHFISPADSSNAHINDLKTVTARLDECRADRGQIPNIVAVDFWESGEVVEAVDALNGVVASLPG